MLENSEAVFCPIRHERLSGLAESFELSLMLPEQQNINYEKLSYSPDLYTVASISIIIIFSRPSLFFSVSLHSSLFSHFFLVWLVCSSVFNCLALFPPKLTLLSLSLKSICWYPHFHAILVPFLFSFQFLIFFIQIDSYLYLFIYTHLKFCVNLVFLLHISVLFLNLRELSDTSLCIFCTFFAYVMVQCYWSYDFYCIKSSHL